MPIYLHPTVPMIKEFWTYGLALAGPGFGFGMETALVMFRLVLSGVFDAYPNLKVAVGHYGEGLPFLLDRVDFAANFAHVAADSGAFVALKRKPSEYLRENMWVSTSCNYLPGAFSSSWNDLGKEHVVLRQRLSVRQDGRVSRLPRRPGPVRRREGDAVREERGGAGGNAVKPTRVCSAGRRLARHRRLQGLLEPGPRR